MSATGSRPFGDGADGFVMGEGSGAFLLKRLADAERDGDKIYAVIRGAGGSSDGKGKGITAPNPVGQVLATQRAWQNAGLDPATATLVEAHGTSTKVGDVVEVESLAKVFGGAPRGSIALGSAKSNIGHLKAGAGAAGLLKAVMAVYEKVLPPTLNAEKPNPNLDFTHSPFFLSHNLQEWHRRDPSVPRRAGVSAYGFGGTNFHLVLEEYIPGMLRSDTKVYTSATVPGNGNKEASTTRRHRFRSSGLHPGDGFGRDFSPFQETLPRHSGRRRCNACRAEEQGGRDMAQGRGRVDRADRGAEPGRAETAGTAGDRLWRPRRAAGPAGQGP